MRICCKNWLDPQLKELQPRIIVTLGRVALQYFFPRAAMTKSKGSLLILDSGIPVFPIFHPAYILRNGNKMDNEYKSDFTKIMSVLTKMNKLKEQQSKFKIKDKDQSDLKDFF